MGNCKYYKEEEFVSHDGGLTWISTGQYRRGALYEADSNDCSDFSGEYFHIQSRVNNNTIYFKSVRDGEEKTISASTNGGSSWTAFTSSTGGTAIATLSNGQSVLIKGLNSNYEYHTFTSSGNINIGGNIMSLLSGDSYSNATLANGYEFNSLFTDCTTLIEADALALPATSLTEYCYYSMFSRCTNLTKAPQLPATSLASHCYAHMFKGCTSLTTAPVLSAPTLSTNCYESMFLGCSSLVNVQNELPATTLATYCYAEMFEGCTSLTTAPELPAETLVNYCYYYMFNYCTSLNYIKCLATNISAGGSRTMWVQNVASSGTFVKACLMNDWTTSTNGIPSNWVVQNDGNCGSSNYLTIKSRSQNNVIYFKCTREGDEKSISASTNGGSSWTQYTSSTGGTAIATLADNEMVLVKGVNSNYQYNVFSSTYEFDVQGNIMSLISGDSYDSATALTSSFALYGIFQNSKVVNASNLELPATTLSLYCYSYMFEGCTGLTSTPQLPATTLANYCYNSMFRGCTSLSVVPTLSVTTLAEGCYEAMFMGCTSLTTAPALPATTLQAYCYRNMFNGCTNLTASPVLSASTLANYCYNRMFYGCTSLNYIKCLATNISASYCLNNWTYNVAANGTFVKASSMSSWTTGTGGIPSNWNVQNA